MTSLPPDVVKKIIDIPDEVLESAPFLFANPWQAYSPNQYYDEDGFPLVPDKDDTNLNRDQLQTQIFNKFHRNPHLNTSVRALIGRITGLGFEITSEVEAIQEVIDLIELDKRNRLYSMWPRYVGKNVIEGELFLMLTLHTDGFVEVDFVDPSTICEGGDGTGVIWHPGKTCYPLFYNVGSGIDRLQVPSIYIAHYPELISVARQDPDFKVTYQQKCKSAKKAYKPLKGYYRFIVATDKGLLTRRAISYLRSVLQWLNHYENLKKYEIDYKKSAASYFHVFSITDAKSFKIWLTMDDDDKQKTGIMAKKTPGGTLVLPPGIEYEIKNPNLTTIRDEDTDILHMVSAGLNEASDVLTGNPTGPYSATRATRGPMTDRTSDEIAWFDRFLRHEFYSAIFYLRYMIGKGNLRYEVEEAVKFENGEPVFKKKQKLPEQLIEVSYPVSEIAEYESKSRAFLGVKHGPVSESLGIPNSEIAHKMGFTGSYGKWRLRKAVEDKKFPELQYEAGVDAESQQESTEGEPGKSRTTPAKNKTQE